MKAKTAARLVKLERILSAVGGGLFEHVLSAALRALDDESLATVTQFAQRRVSISEATTEEGRALETFEAAIRCALADTRANGYSATAESAVAPRSRRNRGNRVYDPRAAAC